MSISTTTLDRIIDDLARQGWCAIPDFVSTQTVAQLAEETQQLRQQQVMRPAGVGKGAERTVNAGIRGDFILWLDEPDLTAAQRDYLAGLEQLRLAANASLQLGLFEFEGHLATYPAGSFYRKHIDRFHNDSLRTLTCILYLNQSWQASDGGQLRVYTNGHGEYAIPDDESRRARLPHPYPLPLPGEGDAVSLHEFQVYEHDHFDVLPQGGTLMTFLSDRFWHEVLPASRERMSVTGWFRTRGEVAL
ncbi:MAG TPA: 2OG-Fe(II) oxygenase [Methylophilaceae bacterium]|nr:2OG-Fe(II) oxygenase [Methylophilaceae bacterium]